MSQKESEKLKVSASSIEEELLCPVCMTVPRSLPIPCCPRGHLLCQTCHNSLQNDKCPSCRLPMGANVSTVAGALVGKIPHPCRFSNIGCEKRDLLQDIVEHEKYCLFGESTDTDDDVTDAVTDDVTDDDFDSADDGTEEALEMVRNEARVAAGGRGARQQQRVQRPPARRVVTEDEGMGMGTGLLLGAGILAAGLGIFAATRPTNNRRK